MSLISQTTSYTTPGTYTYTIPQGVSALEFYLWGAGGATGSTGETVSRQTGTRQVGSIQTGTQVVGTVVVQAAIAAGQTAVSKELVVPPGVTSVNITAAGGGGGGGGSDGGDKNHWIFGLGGGAGEVASTSVAVLPGQVITATVGAGGAGGRTDAKGKPGTATTVAVAGAAVVTAAGGGGGTNRAVKAVSPGAATAIGAGSGGSGSPKGYWSSGAAGSSGAVIVSWAAVPEVTQAIYEPVYTPVYEPVYTSYVGGAGGPGGTGGYANRKIRVTPGDIVVVSVGCAGAKYVGGRGLSTPTNFSGGTAGVAAGEGRGGGGGAATVVTVNGIVVAVAAGGGGGGGGGQIGTKGKAGGNAKITGGSGGSSLGVDSAAGQSTGGGGGGGYFGGLAGASSISGSDGGGGGVCYGTIMQAGSSTTPGGVLVPGYPSTTPGYSDKNGAALLVFTKSFNINLKKSNNWRSIDRAWVKVGGVWKELLNGWTKVSGSWQPLITSRSIEGAENLDAPTVIYTLTPDVSSVDEGDTVTFTLGGTGLTNGTVVAYTATGIDATALTSGALSGTFVVGTSDTISFTPKLNQTTYGSRTLRVFLDNKGVSASCIVNNISLTPIYSIFGDVSSVAEGDTVTFTMSSSGATTGEIVRWSISGVNAADLSSGAMSGQFIVGSVESASFTLSNDLTSEGLENIIIRLDSKAASASCAVADTSRTPIPFTGSMTLSGSGTWTVPAYVTSATFTICGGGGGGGGSDGGDKNHNLFGLGGGASDLVAVTRTVSAGQTYSYNIGAGGIGGGGQGAGAGGSPSTITYGASTILSQSGGYAGSARAQGSFSPGRGSSNGGASGGNGSAAGYKNVPGSAGQNGFGVITWAGIQPG